MNTFIYTLAAFAAAAVVAAAIAVYVTIVLDGKDGIQLRSCTDCHTKIPDYWQRCPICAEERAMQECHRLRDREKNRTAMP